MAGPPRVRVTSTRSTAPRRRARPVALDVQEQTGLGEVYLRGLMRAQFRLSMGVLGTGALLLGGLPLAFMVSATLRETRLFGIPLPWLILGVLVYPGAVLAARLYVRAAERIEQQFVDASGVGRTNRPDADEPTEDFDDVDRSAR